MVETVGRVVKFTKSTIPCVPLKAKASGAGSALCLASGIRSVGSPWYPCAKPAVGLPAAALWSQCVVRHGSPGWCRCRFGCRALTLHLLVALACRRVARTGKVISGIVQFTRCWVVELMPFDPGACWRVGTGRLAAGQVELQQRINGAPKAATCRSAASTRGDFVVHGVRLSTLTALTTTCRDIHRINRTTCDVRGEVYASHNIRIICLSSHTSSYEEHACLEMTLVVVTDSEDGLTQYQTS